MSIRVSNLFSTKTISLFLIATNFFGYFFSFKSIACFSTSFYTRNICYFIMEMTVIPELEETLESWRKKKKQKLKKKEQEEKEETEK